MKIVDPKYKKEYDENLSLEITGFIISITDADRMLAKTLIDEIIPISSKDEKEMAKAQKEFDKGVIPIGIKRTHEK